MRRKSPGDNIYVQQDIRRSSRLLAFPAVVEEMNQVNANADRDGATAENNILREI